MTAQANKIESLILNYCLQNVMNGCKFYAEEPYDIFREGTSGTFFCYTFTNHYPQRCTSRWTKGQSQDCKNCKDSKKVPFLNQIDF